jgi:hypothetical protein
MDSMTFDVILKACNILATVGVALLVISTNKNTKLTDLIQEALVRITKLETDFKNQISHHEISSLYLELKQIRQSVSDLAIDMSSVKTILRFFEDKKHE